MVFAAISHAVASDQHLRGDLTKTIEHGIGAHIGGAHAPDAADADHRQKGHHGFGHIGQIGGDAIAGAHALGLKVARQGSHLTAQFGPTQFAALAFFVVADDGRHASVVCRPDMTQHLLGVVDLRAWKPNGARHGVFGQHR